ncbi:hypothetical protein DAEQUDRAFT_732311, partial [Daedalea quercina L-15889]
MKGRNWRCRISLNLAPATFALVYLGGGLGAYISITYISAASLLTGLANSTEAIIRSVLTAGDETAAAVVRNETDSILTQMLAAAAADIWIMVSLCQILRGSGSGLPSTAGMISRLTLYAITRGILTLVVQLLSVATHFIDIYRGTYTMDIVTIPGSALYVNSFLAVLNVRRHLRETLHLYSDVQLEVPTTSRERYAARSEP